MVESFRQAVNVLAETGAEGRESFEAAARTFTAEFLSLMAPRKNPFHAYTDELFTDEDWELVAAVSDESIDIEKNLYSASANQCAGGHRPGHHENCLSLIRLKQESRPRRRKYEFTKR